MATGNEVTGEFAPVKEPVPAAPSVTKFYFCETCGKRITDKQILEGLGRDKKLKGVFCKDCALGVTTMEFEAISEADLRKPIRKSGGNSIPLNKEYSADSKPVQNTSRAGIAAAARTPTPPHGKSNERIQSEPTGNATKRAGQRNTSISMIIAGVAAVVFVTVLAIIFATQSSRSSRHDNASNRVNDPAPSPVRAATAAPVAPQDNSNPQLTPIKPPIEPIVEAPHQSDPAMTAKADYDNMIKQIGSMDKNDTAGRIAAIDTFLKEHGESTLAPSARTLRDGIVAMEQFNKSHAPVLDLPDQQVHDPKQQPTEPPIANAVDDKPVKKKPDEQIAVSALPADSDDLQSARKAYDDFSADFERLLCSADSKSATAKLVQAENDAVLKPFHDKLTLDRKALGWLDEILHFQSEGLKKLTGADHFELRKINSAPVSVGKREPLQVLTADDERITFGDKSVSFSIATNDLDVRTRCMIARLALSNDAHGALLGAFIDVLSIVTVPSEHRSSAAIRQLLQKAQADGADASEIRYLTEKLNAMDAKAQETLAENAWNMATNLCKQKNWKGAQQALQAFIKNYGDTALGHQKQKDIVSLMAEIEDAITQMEGYVFDFKSPDGFDRFKKFLAPTLSRNMEMKSENGKPYFCRTVTNNEGAVHLQSTTLKFGKNWDMRIKVNYCVSNADLGKVDKASRLMLRFLKRGEKATEWADSHRHFEMSVGSSYGGNFYHSWGKEDEASGIQRTVGTGLVGLGGKSSFNADGIYTLKLSMRQNTLKLEANSVLVGEYQVPSEVAAQISDSPLAIYFNCKEQSVKMNLEEFQFVNRDNDKK